MPEPFAVRQVRFIERLPALYAAMLVFVPMRWEGFSSADRAVSELSAIGAPTRSLWVSLALAWTLLYLAFGLGVRASAGQSRALRTAGGVLVAQAVLGLFWPPMHLRGTEVTLTDALHIVWTVLNGALTLGTIGFAAAAGGKWFRGYSVATMVVLVAAGAVTGSYAGALEAGLPTPGMGVWERVDIGAWLVWVAVLSVRLLRTPTDAERGDSPAPLPAGLVRGIELQ